MTTRIDVSHFPSPLGPLCLAAVDGKLVHLDFEGNDDRLKAISARHFPKIEWRGDASCTSVPVAILRWLEGYFAGEAGDVPQDDIRMVGTGFQQQVWQALLNIPAGYTRTYGGLANEMGNPDAVRAVARANALNPVSILVPCHRVIGSNGKLTGYAGGLDRKQWLLDHEAGMRITAS